MSTVSAASAQGTRNDRRRERTREDILAAAVRVLSDRGLHETKITDIALEADVGVGTFYLHFPTKKALFDAVVENTVLRMMAAIDSARAEGTDTIDRMCRSNRAFTRFAAENRAIFRIVFGHAGAYHDVIRAAQGLFAADVGTSLRAGIAEGLLRPMPVDIVAHGLVGLATQALTWSLESDQMAAEEIADVLNAILLDGLRLHRKRPDDARP